MTTFDLIFPFKIALSHSVQSPRRDSIDQIHLTERHPFEFTQQNTPFLFHFRGIFSTVGSIEQEVWWLSFKNPFQLCGSQNLTFNFRKRQEIKIL